MTAALFGAVLTGEALEGLVKPGHHGTTFGGNPLACRLGLAVLDEIEASSLLERVDSRGEWFGQRLRKLQAQTPAIVDVRGTGFMWGIELDRAAKPVAQLLMEQGFIVGTARDNVLRLLPPFITPKKAFTEFLEALRTILAVQPESKAPSALARPGWQTSPNNPQSSQQGAVTK